MLSLVGVFICGLCFRFGVCACNILICYLVSVGFVVGFAVGCFLIVD